MEKKQEQQSSNKSKRNERKVSSLKIFGNSSNNGDDASSLIGSIVEKGVVSSDNNIKPIQPPQPSVLPFPVARHRYHGPHWTPASNSNVDEDSEDEREFSNFDPISVFAKPVQRKEKKVLDLSLGKEAMQSDDFSKTKGREANKSRFGKTKRQRRQMTYGKAMKNVGKNTSMDSLGANADMVASMDVDVESHLNSDRTLTKTEKGMSELSISPISKMDLDDSHQLHLQENIKDADSDNFSRESGLMAIDGQVSAKTDSAKAQFGRIEEIDPIRTTLPKQFHNLGNHQGSMSLDSEIDAENRARLEKMSQEEIAQAQAEIMEKMNPALLQLLKKRGQEKLKHQKHSSSDLASNIELGIKCKNQSNNSINSPNIESNNSHKETTSSNATKSGFDNCLEQNVDHVSGSLWNAWSQRVETVRELRFSLDGTVVENDFVYIPETSGDNAAECDFLRTEGDPGAAGYTIIKQLCLQEARFLDNGPLHFICLHLCLIRHYVIFISIQLALLWPIIAKLIMLLTGKLFGLLLLAQNLN